MAISTRRPKRSATKDSVRTVGDAVIWRLNSVCVRALGRYEASNHAFECLLNSDGGNTPPARRCTRIGSHVGNHHPREPSYEGRAYDWITVGDLSFAELPRLGKPEAARPALLKAHRYQQDAVAEMPGA
jgi:hypothetical protein